MTTVKVIGLVQPWATLVACGAKKFETRSWATQYRGRLAIHAAKRLDRAALHRLRSSPHCPDALLSASLPRGAIVATARLVQCPPVELVDASEAERLFGDFSDGRYAWQLTDVVPVDPPIPHVGRQGLYEPDERTLIELRRAVRTEQASRAIRR